MCPQGQRQDRFPRGLHHRGCRCYSPKSRLHATHEPSDVLRQSAPNKPKLELRFGKEACTHTRTHTHSLTHHYALEKTLAQQVCTCTHPQHTTAFTTHTHLSPNHLCKYIENISNWGGKKPAAIRHWKEQGSRS